MNILNPVRHSTKDLKEALHARAEEFVLWLFPNARSESGRYLVGSLDGQSGRSLSICASGRNIGIWKDFAVDQGGDNLLELLRASRGTSFQAACREASDWLRLSPIMHPSKAPRRAESTIASRDFGPYRLSEAEATQGRTFAERLILDPSACDPIARERGWRSETVLELAHELSVGLSGEGRLVFLYDTGVKERWRDENGSRRFRFRFGRSDALWRGGLLPAFQRVFVTEGETDGITLVDAGLENDGKTLVVALPSANTLKSWWGPQLAEKDVTLCLDADAAGRAGTEKLTVLLASHVASLNLLRLEALLK